MHPTNTIYRLADCPRDYAACHKILKQHGRPDSWRLHFPTIVAVRDTRVLGFLSTVKCAWCVMAGPLEFAEPQPNGIMMIRLAEAYEVVLRSMGVTRYCIAVERRPDNENWLGQVQRMGYEPFDAVDSHFYLERRLNTPSLAA